MRVHKKYSDIAAAQEKTFIPLDLSRQAGVAQEKSKGISWFSAQNRTELQAAMYTSYFSTGLGQAKRGEGGGVCDGMRWIWDSDEGAESQEFAQTLSDVPRSPQPD